MTAKELLDKLEAFIYEDKSRENLPVYFDTDARTFNYHHAKIGNVYCEDSPEMAGLEMILLCEERP